MSVCLCICVCMYVYVYLCIPLCACVFVCMYVYVTVCVFVSVSCESERDGSSWAGLLIPLVITCIMKLCDLFHHVQLAPPGLT